MRLSEKEYRQTLSYFEKLVQDDPGHWGHWADIGFCHGKLRQWQEAARAFEYFLAKGEATIAVLDMLAHVYIMLEEFSKAAAILDKAHAMEPNNTRILYKMAVLYFRKGDIERSVAPLQKIVTLKPHHPKAQFSLGVVHHRLNDVEAAERQLGIVKGLCQNLGDQLAKTLSC